MDFDILQSTDSLNQSLFIEASAGTGKTFTIEHLVVRRLLEPMDDGSFLQIQNVLVVTFTHACADELRARIWTTIERCIALLRREITPEDPVYIERIKEAGADCVKQAIKRLYEALFSYADAVITTIHSFCMMSMKEYSNVQLSMCSRADIEQYIRDFFIYELDENLFFPEQIAVLVKAYGGFYSLVEKIAPRLWKKEPTEIITAKRIWHALLEKVSCLPYSEQEVVDICIEECQRYKHVSTRSGIKQEVLDRIKAFAQLFSERPEVGCLIFRPFFIQELLYELKVKAPSSTHAQFFEDVRVCLDPYIQDLCSTERIFLHLVASIEQFVARIQDKRGEMCIERLLHKMCEMIEEKEFVLYLQNRFQAVVVDEFQDTDPQQWHIFSTCFLKERSYLYLVGDPKQAIYRFRGADIYSYMQAKQCLQQTASVKTLRTNFRSTASLNGALNRLFSNEKAEALFRLSKTEEVVVAPVLETKDTTQDISSSVIFCIVEGEKGRAVKLPTVDMEEKTIFPFIAHTLSVHQNETCAILVKDRYQAKRVSQYLKERGVFVQSHQTDPLTTGAGFQFFQQLVRCLRYPKKLSTLLTLLALPPFTYSDEYICYLKTGTQEALIDRARYVTWLCDMQKMVQLSKIGLFFETLISALPETNDELLLELEQLFDCMVDTQESSWSVDRLEKFLVAMKRMSEYEMPSRIHGQESLVQVLTVHKSKGLEYDIVFSLATSCTDSLSEEAEEERSEKIRQLYVAATRAKKRAYLFVIVATDREESVVDSSMDLYLESLLPGDRMKAIDFLTDEGRSLVIEKKLIDAEVYATD